MKAKEKDFKLLGIYFDEYLSFDHHISHLCAKVSKSQYCLNRIKNFVTEASLTKLYHAMIHSCLVYCINVYGCANKTNLEPLVIKQKQAIRTITNSAYREHTAPLFARLNILPIDHQIHCYKIKFMHKFTFRRLPLSFAEMWKKKQ